MRALTIADLIAHMERDLPDHPEWYLWYREQINRALAYPATDPHFA